MVHTLEEIINNDFKKAMLERDILKKNILSIVKGEIEKEAKKNKWVIIHEEDILAIIKRTLKPINEVIETCDPDTEFYQTSIKEKEILEVYLPQMMTEDQIRNEITKLNNNNLNLGLVMKHFSSLNADKSIVRTIFENEFK